MREPTVAERQADFRIQRGKVLGILRAANKALSPYTISELTGIIPGSVTSRIRDLRLAKFGNYEIVKEYLGGRVWGYRLIKQGIQLDLPGAEVSNG